jgi:hypothetical protein
MGSFEIEIDNPGGGNCGFYAFFIGLIPYLKEELHAIQSSPDLITRHQQASNAKFLRELYPEHDFSVTPLTAEAENIATSILSFNFNDVWKSTEFLKNGMLILRKKLQPMPEVTTPNIAITADSTQKAVILLFEYYYKQVTDYCTKPGNEKSLTIPLEELFKIIDEEYKDQQFNFTWEDHFFAYRKKNAHADTKGQRIEYELDTDLFYELRSFAFATYKREHESQKEYDHARLVGQHCLALPQADRLFNDHKCEERTIADVVAVFCRAYGSTGFDESVGNSDVYRDKVFRNQIENEARRLKKIASIKFTDAQLRNHICVFVTIPECEYLLDQHLRRKEQNNSTTHWATEIDLVSLAQKLGVYLDISDHVVGKNDRNLPVVKVMNHLQTHWTTIFQIVDTHGLGKKFAKSLELTLNEITSVLQDSFNSITWFFYREKSWFESPNKKAAKEIIDYCNQKDATVAEAVEKCKKAMGSAADESFKEHLQYIVDRYENHYKCHMTDNTDMQQKALVEADADAGASLPTSLSPT